MNVDKIREIIADLESEIAVKVKAISALRSLLSEETPNLPGTVVGLRLENSLIASSSMSYVDLAVKAIEGAAGRPMPMTLILDYVRREKNNPRIERRSVEATLIQHMKAKGDLSRLIKVAPGVYALRRYPRSEPAA
jgi:hypothetical protein